MPSDPSVPPWNVDIEQTVLVCHLLQASAKVGDLSALGWRVDPASIRVTPGVPLPKTGNGGASTDKTKAKPPAPGKPETRQPPDERRPSFTAYSCVLWRTRRLDATKAGE